MFSDTMIERLRDVFQGNEAALEAVARAEAIDPQGVGSLSSASSLPWQENLRNVVQKLNVELKMMQMKAMTEDIDQLPEAVDISRGRQRGKWVTSRYMRDGDTMVSIPDAARQGKLDLVFTQRTKDLGALAEAFDREVAQTYERLGMKAELSSQRYR